MHRPAASALDTVQAFEFEELGSGYRFSLSPAVVVAGYTGRDADAVEAHIAELAAHGVPRPDSVPAFYPVDTSALACSGETIEVGPATSGEVEPVLIIDGADWWVGIGSDHTDRQLERSDIAASKRACPKPVSHQVVRYERLERCWDQLTLEAWADGQLYQQGAAAGLLAPADLLDAARAVLGTLPDQLVLFMGTLPLLSGSFAYASEFQARLSGWNGTEALELKYDIDSSQE